ncbi:MAG: hypothetical protein WC791_00565 [Candidatus Paceibacterota bacterium]
MMSKFIHCHPSGKLMWCQHYNGSWVAFPIDKNDKDEDVIKEIATASKEE